MEKKEKKPKTSLDEYAGNKETNSDFLEAINLLILYNVLG